MNDFQRYLVDEFAEDYQEGRISRRAALKLIASVTGSLVVANSILAACAPANPPPGQTSATQADPTISASATVSADDPAVQGSDVQFPGDDGTTLLGYLARPGGEGSAPVVLVCHENRGLTEHITNSELPVPLSRHKYQYKHQKTTKTIR